MHFPVYSSFLLLVITFYGLGLQTSASHPEEQQDSPQADSRTSISSFSSWLAYLGFSRSNKTKTDPPLVGDVVREEAVIVPQVRVTDRNQDRAMTTVTTTATTTTSASPAITSASPTPTSTSPSTTTSSSTSTQEQESKEAKTLLNLHKQKPDRNNTSNLDASVTDAAYEVMPDGKVSVTSEPTFAYENDRDFTTVNDNSSSMLSTYLSRVTASSETDKTDPEITKRRNRPQWWEEMEQLRRETLQKRSTSPSTDTESYTSDTAGLILSTQLPIDVAGKTNDHRKPKTRRFKSNAKTSPLEKKQRGKEAKRKKEAIVVVSPEEKMTTRLTTTDHVNETGNCPTCAKRDMSQEAIKELRLLMFQETLMEKLRIDPASLLENQGRGSGSPRLPDSVVDGMMRDNARRQFEEEEKFFATDKQIIISATDMGQDCIMMRTTGCYEFELEGKIVGLVASAELWWYKMRDRGDISAQTFVVYELERSQDSSLRRRNLILRNDTYTKEGWISQDVTRAVARWVEKGRDHEMLAIRCKTCVTRYYKSLFGAKNGYLPLLIIKYADSAHDRRERRSADSCDPDAECCKLPLTVDMRRAVMRFIYAPRELSIGYCYGFCNQVNYHTYNHTMVTQFLRFGTNTLSADMNEQLMPCCVPISLIDVYVLIWDNSRSTLRQQLVPNIVVDKCGCA